MILIEPYLLYKRLINNMPRFLKCYCVVLLTLFKFLESTEILSGICRLNLIDRMSSLLVRRKTVKERKQFYLQVSLIPG